MASGYVGAGALGMGLQIWTILWISGKAAYPKHHGFETPDRRPLPTTDWAK